MEGSHLVSPATYPRSQSRWMVNPWHLLGVFRADCHEKLKEVTDEYGMSLPTCDTYLIISLLPKKDLWYGSGPMSYYQQT